MYKRTSAFTLLEIIISISIISLLAATVPLTLNFKAQTGKAQDVRRKAELKTMATVLSDYYNDNGKYPDASKFCVGPVISSDGITCSCTVCGTDSGSPSFQPYLSKLGCDPQYPQKSYMYQFDCQGQQWFRLCSSLSTDTQHTFAYGVSSGNVTVDECKTFAALPTSTPTLVPSATNTPIPLATNTPVPSATNTPIPSATSTPVPTATNTPIPTATIIPSPTATPIILPPNIAMVRPAEGTTYVTGSSLTASYSCSDPNGLPITSCTGTVANNGSISTASIGAKTFTVNASNSAGKTSSLTTNYIIGYSVLYLSPMVAPPSVNNLFPLGLAPWYTTVKWNMLNSAGTKITNSSTITSIKYTTMTCGAAAPAYSSSYTNATPFLPGTSPKWDFFQSAWLYNWQLPGKGCYALYMQADSSQIITFLYKVN